MGKIVHLFVSFSIFISAGYALKCYGCVSDNVESCKTESPSRKEVQCGNVIQGNIPFCYYKIELDKKKNKENATYSCESIKQGVKLEKDSIPPIPQCKPTSDNFEVKECGGCTEELCNTAASVSSRNMVTFWYFFVTCLFAKLLSV